MEFGNFVITLILILLCLFSFWICMKYLPLNVKPHAANQSRVTKETHLCIHYFVYTLSIDTVQRLIDLLCDCPLWHYAARPVNITAVKYNYLTFQWKVECRRFYPPLRLQFHNERSCINININRLFSISLITEARNSRRLHKIKIAEKTCTLW